MSKIVDNCSLLISIGDPLKLVHKETNHTGTLSNLRLSN